MDKRDKIEKFFFLKEIGVNMLSPEEAEKMRRVLLIKPPSERFKKEEENKQKEVLSSGLSLKEKFLSEIEKEIAQCKKCPLFSTRKNYVFGEGSMDAEIMFIGEAPGEEEDNQGRPFVGKAGKKLTEMIKAMGFEREDVFIANIVKCRPPGNATPTPQIRRTCFPYLQKQIAIIKPKVLIALGNVAAQTLLDTKETITRLRGKFGKYQGIPVMPTYHPSYVIRNYTVAVRKAVWEDLKKVLALLNENR